MRAFLYVFQGVLTKRGFHETIEHIDPEGPDNYIYENDDQMISVTLAHRGPGVLTITASSASPVKDIIEEAVEVLLEGIRVLLKPIV